MLVRQEAERSLFTHNKGKRIAFRDTQIRTCQFEAGLSAQTS